MKKSIKVIFDSDYAQKLQIIANQRKLSVTSVIRDILYGYIDSQNITPEQIDLDRHFQSELEEWEKPKMRFNPKLIRPIRADWFNRKPLEERVDPPKKIRRKWVNLKEEQDRIFDMIGSGRKNP